MQNFIGLNMMGAIPNAQIVFDSDFDFNERDLLQNIEEATFDLSWGINKGVDFYTKLNTTFTRYAEQLAWAMEDVLASQGAFKDIEHIVTMDFSLLKENQEIVLTISSLNYERQVTCAIRLFVDTEINIFRYGNELTLQNNFRFNKGPISYTITTVENYGYDSNNNHLNII